MRLDDMVSGWMTERPTTLTPDRPLSDACTIMFDRDIRHIPVTREGRLVGIISDRDLTRRGPIADAMVHQLVDRFFSTKVSDVMTQDDVRTVGPMTTLAEAARVLIATKRSALPVLDGDSLVGIITTHDLLRALVDTTSSVPL